jgi:Holliday junction DNA helicase, RuvA subunit
MVIGHLSGKILAKTGRELILDVSGVGYQVFVSSRMNLSIGSETSMFVRTVVREDEISLYGFVQTDERDLFDSLCEVSGIGPKLAMTIIEELGYEQTVDAISGGDERALQSVTGIGSKTAKLMILSLGGKYDAPIKPRDSSLVDALINLGWKEREAIDALNSVGNSAGSQQEQLKAALKYLGGAKTKL